MGLIIANINYSETCANGHLYSETTCIKRPLHDVPKVSAHYILTCIQRPPLCKGHYEVALAWPFNTGFTVPPNGSRQATAKLMPAKVISAMWYLSIPLILYIYNILRGYTQKTYFKAIGSHFKALNIIIAIIREI